MNPQPRHQHLTMEEVGDVTIVRFVDKKILDEQNVQIIGEQLFDLVEKERRKKILLNFRNVDYIGSVMKGKLITLQKKCKNAGARLVLCNIHKEIMEVFEVIQLDKFLTIFSDEQAALQAFS